MEQTEQLHPRYRFASGYGADTMERAGLDGLAREIFGFDFSRWCELGYWRGQYIPYTLLEGERAVANVSASPMELEIFGRRVRWLQLGTVMTAPDCRGQGLCRLLLERVLAEWEDRCGAVYLFANDSVLDFYPRFGFARMEQAVSFRLGGGAAEPARKLDLDSAADRRLLFEAAEASRPRAAVSLLGSAELVLFYAVNFYRDCVYWLERYGAAFLLDWEEGELLDVFCPGEVPLETLLQAALPARPKGWRLGFTPKGWTPEYPLAGDTLFVRGPEAALLAGRAFRFPELSHT